MTGWENTFVIARPFAYLLLGMLVGVASNHIKRRWIVLLSCGVLALEILVTAWPDLHWRGGRIGETLAVAVLDALPLLLAYYLLAFLMGRYLTRAVLRVFRRS